MQQPNATLYVSNMDWSVKKKLLQRALYSLFGRHGKVRSARAIDARHAFPRESCACLRRVLFSQLESNSSFVYRCISLYPFSLPISSSFVCINEKILEVITLRKEGLRGQAWIMFDDVQSATSALQAEQGFTFFQKDIKIAYAKEKSDRIAKRDGTYVQKAKRRKLTEPVVTPAAAIQPVESVTTTTTTTTPAHNTDAATAPPPTTIATDAATTASADGTTVEEEETAVGDVTDTPSHILFAQDLPTECNEMMLAMLFQQYAGYKEVRIPRQGLAFIEFKEEAHATLALKGLNGFKLTTNDTLNLKYGKA